MMLAKTPFLSLSDASRRLRGAAVMLAGLPLLTVLVTLGCSSSPEVEDVRLTYARKESERLDALRETFFNASHSEFEEYRTASLQGVMPLPGRDGETVELRSWPLDGLPPGFDWSEEMPDHLDERLDYLPPERVVPARLTERQREEWLRDETGLLTWIGSMRQEERDELLALSSDPEWQRAVFALAQDAPADDEITGGASVIQEGYNVLMLPRNTYPASDATMYDIPEAFDRLDFFRFGATARNEEHALHAFDRTSDSVRQALILTVDGHTTIWMTPQRRHGMSDREYERQQKRFMHCLRVYFEIVRNDYRPPEIFDEDRREVFLEEQERLREQRRRAMERQQETDRENRLRNQR